MATGTGDIAGALEQFPAVSLSELDERAPLLRRIDNRYAAPHDAFLELLRRLRANHDVLDMDGRREFTYQTVYFETSGLRCLLGPRRGTLSAVQGAHAPV